MNEGLFPLVGVLEDVPEEQREQFIARMVFELQAERQRGSRACRWALETIEALGQQVLELEQEKAERQKTADVWRSLEGRISALEARSAVSSVEINRLGNNANCGPDGDCG